MSKKSMLIILDGYGLGDHKKDDAIYNTPTPYMDKLIEEYPHSQLEASGENVGLPDGQMGNSEVGHLNIGGGRGWLVPEESRDNQRVQLWQGAQCAHPFHGSDVGRRRSLVAAAPLRPVRHGQGIRSERGVSARIHGRS